MAKSSNPKRKKAPKTVLKLPDLEQSKSAVLNSLVSASSQRSYDHAIREFIEWYCSEPRLAFNKTVVTRYRISLEQKHYAPSTINLRLAAVRRLAYEASDSGLLSPDLAAGIRRVKGVRRLGVKIGNWLTAEEGRRLLSGAGNATLRQRRNYAMLAVLAGCGLGRAEAAALKIEDLQGGTFTITNGGVYGSLFATPILNPPQSGILGMHKIMPRPIALDGKVEARPMMYLALSYDHRAIDGKEAVTFLVKVKECIEDPKKLPVDF